MQQCQVNFHLIFAPGFDPDEWCLKNGLLSGGLNPRPLSHEPSALTTRPRLLALALIVLIFFFDVLTL
jgi:hypothetical protein